MRPSASAHTIHALEVQKECYELAYAARFLPSWSWAPVGGLGWLLAHPPRHVASASAAPPPRRRTGSLSSVTPRAGGEAAGPHSFTASPNASGTFSFCTNTGDVFAYDPVNTQVKGAVQQIKGQAETAIGKVEDAVHDAKAKHEAERNSLRA